MTTQKTGDRREERASVISWTIWSFAVLFLFYEFILRIIPTLIIRDLMRAFSITAGQLGLLSACYFYGYAPMQLPVGLLMDRFGARKLLFFASCICGIGGILFGSAGAVLPAAFGRFLMGIGSAFAFIGMIYVCSHWFPKKQLALLVGIGNSIGMLGAVGASGPFIFIVNILGWRWSLNALGVGGMVLALCLFFFLRHDHPTEIRKGEIKKASRHLVNNLKIVCTNYRAWINAIIGLLFYMTTAAFASLWGVPFLEKNYALSTETAGLMISMIFVGWIIGGPLIGWISDRIKRRKPLLYISVSCTLFSLLPILYLSSLPIWMIFALLLLVGFFSSGQLLVFSIAIEVNPIEVKGTSIAFTNFITAVGSSLMQPLLGWLLDARWQGMMQDGARFYQLSNYRFAMTSFPITLLLALLLLFFLKDRKKGAISHHAPISCN